MCSSHKTPFFLATPRFIAFVAGALLVILVVMSAIFDESFALVELTAGRSVAWWTWLLGIMLAGARTFIPPEVG